MNPFTLRLSPLAIALSLLPLSQAIAQEHTDFRNIERLQVTSQRSDVMAEITEDAQKLVAMPGALGDPLQAVFALPGVVVAGGDMSAHAVRGSSPDDNLFEVDFMPAGYIFHDFGLSIFNKHLIQDFQLHSAGYGAGYSDATGAVFDVSLRNPRYQPITTTVDLTMFNAGIFVEGQLTGDSAFYLSGRKSMLPVFFDEGEELEDDDGQPSGVILNSPPDDHDYQGKWVTELNDRQTLTLSVTGAEDSAGANFGQRAEMSLKSPEYQGDAVFKRGFNSQNLIWDHRGRDITVKLGLGALHNEERLEYGKQATRGAGFYESESDRQMTYKARIGYQASAARRWIVDAAYYDNRFNYDFDIIHTVCTELDPDCELNKGKRLQGQHKLDIDRQFVGLTQVWDINNQWQSSTGLQWQRNSYTGEDFVHPRLALSYFVSDDSTITARYGSYNRMQDIDTLLSGLGNPALKSQTARHLTLGFQQFLANEWSWSVEGYYKTMDDLPLALDAKESESTAFYSNEVSGRAYGADLLINKNKLDNWYGWLAISYSKSERTDHRHKITRDYYADTPLVVNMVLNYQFNERWNGGLNFTARSGQAYTPIIGVRENLAFDNRFLPIYGEPFSKRFDLYHRLDLRLERKTDFWGLDGMLVFELMNAYNQDNVSGIDLDYRKITATNQLLIKEETDSFEMRPSVGFSVTF